MLRTSQKATVVIIVVVIAAMLSGCAGTRRLKAENAQLKEQVRKLSDALATGDSDTSRLAAENAALKNELSGAKAVVAEKDTELEDMRSKLAAKGFDVSLRGGMVVVSLPTQILYPSGSAVLSSAGKEQLRTLASELNGQFKDFLVEVQGHTDNDPIKRTKDKYKSNWELSYDRAQAVGYYLMEGASVKPERVHVGAYGQYSPVAANSTNEGKAKNRRVEVVALRSAD